MRSAVLKIIGNHISPFVRKVLAVCEIKGLPYEIDSIVPFFGNERFGELSPLRRIPVLLDGATVINDSSVICEYLEEKWPKVPVLPGEPAPRAEARFLDEFADTRLADVALWKIFGRAVVAPAIFGAERDIAAIDRTVAEELPGVIDLLELWAPTSGFKFGNTLGLADISVASHFANFRWARQRLDAARWPRAASWIERVSQSAPLMQLNTIGEKLLRVPPDDHRPVLEGLGVTVASETVGTKVPRRGPMTAL
jgi:glutathione S-transferase